MSVDSDSCAAARSALVAGGCREGGAMRHVMTFAPERLTALAFMATLMGCAAKETDKSASDSPAAATAAGGVATNAKVPLTSTSEDAKALYSKGRDLTEQLRNQEARKLFEQAVAKDSTFALAHYNLALTSASPKEFFEHVKHAVALADKASDGERLLILGLQANANADQPKALQYAEELVAKYPQDERAHLNLGNAYLGRQETDKAIAEYQKATQINPNYSIAYNSLGYAYRAVDNNTEAEKAFKKYIELVPNDPNPYDSYAELLMKLGRFDESIEQYRKALAVDPHFSSSNVGIAANLMFQGKPDAAVAELQKLYDSTQDAGVRRNALTNQAVVHADAGKTDQALQRLEQLDALSKQAADTAAMAFNAVTMGDVLVEAGRAPEARAHYDKAMAMVNGSSLSAEMKADLTLGDRYNKARVALATNDLATAKSEAAEYLKGAEAKQNDFRTRQAHLLNGMIANREKRYDDAIAELAKSIPQDPYVTYQTALAYQGKGDAAKARELAKQAADANVLPAFNYAFVRTKAKKLAQ
jgi:tetratricopeptide (TPR) repeat protein